MLVDLPSATTLALLNKPSSRPRRSPRGWNGERSNGPRKRFRFGPNGKVGGVGANASGCRPKMMMGNPQ
jgi:hypothetical protein